MTAVILFFRRFIMNLPAEEIASAARLGFQLEQAWWFYDDFYRLENPRLPKMNLKVFIQALLERYPEWTEMYNINIDELSNAFLKYKAQVPTCGAILLNPELTKCLMVQGWNSGTWTFPKGKIAKGEAPEQCAAREVAEEIGYDISDKLNSSDYIQNEAGPKALRLYIVPGVPENTGFQTLTRKEIGAIRWFALAELSNPNSNHRFFNVNSFLGRLKAYVKRQKKSTGSETSPAMEVPASAPKQKTKKIAKADKTPASTTQSPAKPKKIAQRPIPSVLPTDTFCFDRSRIEAAFLTAWNKVA